MTINGTIMLKMKLLSQNISHHGVKINMTIILDVVECTGRFLNTFRKLHLFLSSGKHVPPLSWAPELICITGWQRRPYK
jgi:hypothetical protein